MNIKPLLRKWKFKEKFAKRYTPNTAQFFRRLLHMKNRELLLDVYNAGRADAIRELTKELENALTTK